MRLVLAANPALERWAILWKRLGRQFRALRRY
jgi:hypothetical protein